ncbi:MAG: LysM peptidoglycan-binding domain-containing protein [Thalassobaculaceae bacterium]|nr:LysM peptidoglycan-binding domain-containing protein [Thalassobaculaceae bacterium]
MVSKPAIVGVIGGAAILAALGLNFWLVPGDDDAEEPRIVAPAVPTKPAIPNAAGNTTTGYTSVLPKREAAGKTTAGKSAAAPSAAEIARRKPSFDIVRVDPDGNTVIAGRAKPNIEVTILDGETEIGKVTSDERGEWVFLPDRQLGPGQFALTLRQTGEPDTAESEEAVVLVVPESGKDIAGRPTTEPSQPLAMVLPRNEAAAGVARVLQAPVAGPAQTDMSAPQTAQTESPQTGSAPTGSAPTAVAKADDGTALKPADTAADKSAAGGPSDDTAPAAQVAEAPSAADKDAEAEGAPTVVKAFPEPAKAPAASDQASAAEVADAGDVSVDVIEYDDKGEVVFGGRTEPNADVEVYIDNKPAGSATADDKGRWQLSPKEPVAPGNYNLRVDKVAPGGAVKARVAFPFVRAAPLKGLPNDRLVVIQPGNNLWVIATRVYGEGTRFVQIHDANRDQIQDPDLIYPGQVFGLPTVN